MEFDVVDDEAIRAGRATDAYFERTAAALSAAGRDPHVVAEVTADQFPDGSFELLSGVRDAAALLEGLDVDADAMRAGRLFDGGPVLRVEGRYLEFVRFETALLGFLSHASGMATAALDCRRAAPESTLLSFGARHVHPSMATAVERSALSAGFDGFSHVAAGEALGRTASGTMPHALTLAFGRGEQEAAWRAFDGTAPADVPRIALVDTFDDEVAETRRAVAALGDDLDGVRVDTTGSRRGDFRHIVREVRWTLRELGREDVDVVCSGGLGPAELRELRDVVDAFGVGGYVSNADPVDFALDVVEVDGEAVAKRGKLPGRKAVSRTPEGEHHVGRAGDPAPADAEDLFEPLVRDGKVVREFDLEATAARALADAERVGY